MTFLYDIALAIVFSVRACFEVLLGRTRRSYRTHTIINAPRSLVWTVTNARNITFDGVVPLSIKIADHPDEDGILEGTFQYGDLVLPIGYRELAVREGEGVVLEIVPERSAPEVARGRDYYVAFTLKDAPGGTELSIAHEITPQHFSDRILVALGVIQNARRIKKHCETLVGTRAESENALVNALITGLLTFTSFLMIWGWEFAAILIALILIHEVGHVVAMRWVGLPVRGIFFVPFLGGVAVAGAPHKSEGDRGFVALMGPGFSIVSTLVFFMIWQNTGEPLAAVLAQVSAFLNVLNLAPVKPLDGGHVLESLLSRYGPILNRVAMLGGMAITIALSLYLELYLLLAFWALTGLAPMMRSTANERPNIPPITTEADRWLLVGYLSTIAFYLVILAMLYN